MKIKNLESILPVMGFNGDVQVSNNLDLTIDGQVKVIGDLNIPVKSHYRKNTFKIFDFHAE
mgnify:CR=1 FL=1